jgi:hypothetical protein
MSEKITCGTHGATEKTYVCTHLLYPAFCQGFVSSPPTEKRPYPDAWCDNCQIIVAEHGGEWNNVPENLQSKALLCSECYKRAKIRNTRTHATLDDLAGLRWKCSSCEEWHTGPLLDFGYSSPDYWTEEHAKLFRRASLLPQLGRRQKTFLNEDYCAIEDRDFFVRGQIRLPILGTDQHLVWGVWGSLSRENFNRLREMDGGHGVTPDVGPMFSWLSNEISEYPETLNLKMYAHFEEPGKRPYFELEPTEHPLAREFYEGIAPERVKQIMLKHVREAQ